jgi:hypothetical protein
MVLFMSQSTARELYAQGLNSSTPKDIFLSLQKVSIWPADIARTVSKNKTPAVHIKDAADKPWYVKLALWVLNKNKMFTPHWEKIETWTYVPYQQDALHEVMMKCIDQDMDYINSGKAVFIIGGKDFAELTGSPVFREVMRFNTGPFYKHDPYNRRQIYGFPIHVVPNMTGVALIPSVLIERTEN